MASLAQILNSKIGKNGKSKTYVANLLGVSEKTIENYMRGLREPRQDALIKLSKALGFELSELSEQSVPREKSIVEPLQPHNGHIDPYKDKYIQLLEEQVSSRMKQLEVFAKANQTLAKTLIEQVIKIRAKIEKVDLAQIQREVHKAIDAQASSVEKAGKYL